MLTTLGVGYALGVRSGRRYRRASKAASNAKPPGEEINYEIDSDEEEEAKGDGRLDLVVPKFSEPCKMVCFTFTGRCGSNLLNFLSVCCLGLRCTSGSQDEFREDRCSVSRHSMTFQKLGGCD